MNELLLHTCCAPCASGCIERLFAEEREFTLYFSNSNIGSREEFEKRLDAVNKLVSAFHLKLLVDDYDHEQWLDHVSGVENYATLPERGMRCSVCFDFSLGRTARKAAELGMNFATTLTVSPHKKSALIFDIGGRHDHFEAYDFKKRDGFKRSLTLSQELELYRQNFCGCEFSIRA